MLHEIEDLQSERSRVFERPEFSSAPPVLSHIDVVIEVPAIEYATRLRAVLGAVLALAMSEEFEDDDFPVDTIPAWFRAVSLGGNGHVEVFARVGALRYSEKIGERPWGLRDWLYRFHPEAEVRGWAWWDLTSLSDGRLRLWVDAWGESFFAWEELRWLLYMCGAREVEGPIIRRPETWAEEVSV
ncbi:hypothetical protein AB0P17_29925 [Streptomyces sp. NPDC088124]|uniref:hypothetical protein n=1 Tax=Streptomyces sp. NPDC088124 TaxID=3154654 RepID=UPI003434047B